MVSLFDPSVITALVLGGALIALIRVSHATDFIIWAAVAMLLVVPVMHGPGDWRSGVISVSDAIAGLSNEGVVTIAALFLVAAGVRETGVLNWLVSRVFGAPDNLFAAQLRLLWPTAFLSGFLNNTPLVAMLLPVVQEWSRRHRLDLSKLLMPLSFASILGGSCTLIGTSTNIIVNGWLIDETTHPGLGMFEMSAVAVPIAVVALAATMLLSRYLLPNRQPALTPTDDPREYVVEMVVMPGSELVGRTIENAGLRGLPELYLIEIERDGDLIPAVSSNIELHANDRLVFAGLVDSVVDLQRFNGLQPATDQTFKLSENRHNRIMVEAVVSDTCPLVGSTIKEGRFRTNYNAAIIALARNGRRVKRKIGDIELRPGDTLLLEARPNFYEQQRNSRDFFLVSKLKGSVFLNARKAPVALAILLGIVVSVSMLDLSMLAAALCGGLLMVATGCCNASVARRAIDWEVLLVIAGAIALGRAMDVSGLAPSLGHFVREVVGMNPTAMLAAVFGLAVLLASLITAKAGAVLMLPIAYAAANDLQVSFMPFLIAVMLASSTTLATPIGYPTNLMVFGPGGYRFSDYLRIGIPVTVIVWIMSVILIPRVWPF